MAAPTPQLRQGLSIAGLLKRKRAAFDKVPDARRQASVQFAMPDTLISVLALFSLKAVFAHLLRGATVPAIAATLGMTANTHRRNVFRRRGRGSLPELINGFYRFANDLEAARTAKSLYMKARG